MEGMKREGRIYEDSSHSKAESTCVRNDCSRCYRPWAPESRGRQNEFQLFSSGGLGCLSFSNTFTWAADWFSSFGSVRLRVKFLPGSGIWLFVFVFLLSFLFLFLSFFLSFSFLFFLKAVWEGYSLTSSFGIVIWLCSLKLFDQH